MFQKWCQTSQRRSFLEQIPFDSFNFRPLFPATVFSFKGVNHIELICVDKGLT